MNFWLKFLISIAIVSLMSLAGVYTYRFLNHKLTSAHTWAAIIGYALLLLVALAAIYAMTFVFIGLLYTYMAG